MRSSRELRLVSASKKLQDSELIIRCLILLLASLGPQLSTRDTLAMLSEDQEILLWLVVFSNDTILARPKTRNSSQAMLTS
jgi:hypothetical protein